MNNTGVGTQWYLGLADGTTSQVLLENGPPKFSGEGNSSENGAAFPDAAGDGWWPPSF